MRLFGRTLLIIAAVACFTLPSSAAAADGWSIRLNGVWSNPDGEVTITNEEDQLIRTQAGSAFGLGLAVEYRFTDRLGLEFGYLTGSESDFDIILADPGGDSLAITDALAFSIFEASLNIRLVSNERIDLYIGPVVARVSYANLSFAVGDETLRIDISDETAFGGVLGLNIPLGQSDWFFNAFAQYLATELDAKDLDDPEDSGTTIDFNPVVVGLGFGYRF